ncbi:MAG TPA: cytochrome c-type biogenesis CcmF C-terminal domain-containing protein [Kofleriaceae bacterium]|nr:cytochrome c-type biogenesis CcmF C-terminal domain-containing protein [Kofleriaceae bacterium]
MNETGVPFSPIALVGTIALLSAYLLAAWAVAAGIAGNVRKNGRLISSSVYALYGFSALVALASALMIYAFLTHDFTIKYIASNSDVSMSAWSKVTALWGGLDGSLLFWVLVLALFSTVAIVLNAKRHRDMIGYVVATIMVVQLFFLSLLIFTKDPFATFLTPPPPDGKCLNPLLQNYWMVIHPPSLYVGFVAATIPFAFGIGALASGRLDDLWLGSVRSWMLICFGFLSLGLILGGRWAYEELGWGGYWAWDPVENAGFIPWFTATAFLHSAIIQEQRGGMKRWNLALVCLTFFLTIFGTFMTRSGIVQSVHAFGEDNVLALQFVVFMAVIAVVSVGLIVYRSNQLASKLEFESFWSREFAFLVNNWILLGCAFFVLFATMFPTISEALDGSRTSVGIPFFNRWMTPFGLLLLFLAGAAPLLAWRKTTRARLAQQFLWPTVFAALVAVVAIALTWDSGKSWREQTLLHRSAIFSKDIKAPISLLNLILIAQVVGSIAQEFIRGMMVKRRQTGWDPISATISLIVSKRRKYGGYIVHLGVALMFFGFGGKAYDRMADRTINVPAVMDQNVQFGADGSATNLPKTASAFTFGEYTFLYEKMITTSDDAKEAVTAQVSIWHDGENLGAVYPAKWKYACEEEATTEVAIRVRFAEDIYVVLTGYDLETQMANFRVFINPLISWVWIGFLVLAFGTMVCLIPQSLVDRVTPGGRGGSGRSTPLGRAGQAGMLALVVGGLAVAAPTDAYAQAEHVTVGGGMGEDGTGWPAMNRPENDTQAKAMKELLCVCGCPRESVFDCKCKSAAQLRGQIMAFLDERDASGKPKWDLGSDTGRTRAYDAVLAFYSGKYGDQFLATPKSKFSWLFPSLAVVGGLGLLAVVGRRFVQRGRAGASSTVAAVANKPEDETYADKLDDELASID